MASKRNATKNHTNKSNPRSNSDWKKEIDY
jgi:hypothetical protein